MRLAELTKLLDQHGINLSLNPDTGKLKPVADQQPPAEVLDRIREGIRLHRAALLVRLERGQRADGRYCLADLQQRPGCCASCAHWEQHAPADLLGRCALVDGWGIHAAHRCPVDKWEARA